MKNFVVLTEDGAFALFFCPHPGGFDSSRVPTPGNLRSKAKKKITPGGEPGERGAGHSIPFYHFGLALVSNFSR